MNKCAGDEGWIWMEVQRMKSIVDGAELSAEDVWR